MQSSTLRGLFLLSVLFAVTGESAQSEPVSDIAVGSRLSKYVELLKEIYPEATSFRELDFLPTERGGSSFVGLVGRLLGEAQNREHEGSKVRRYMYFANKGEQSIGVAHGSAFETINQTMDVFVFYDSIGNIVDLRVFTLPEGVRAEFEKGGFLKQFIGRNTEDFEVIRGRKGRIQSRGAFLTQARRPSGGEARSYFDKLVRSVRFNTAFVDVAHFITQHPDLADQPVNSFPERVEVTSGKPMAGPEAFARNPESGSPIDGKPFLLRTLELPAPVREAAPAVAPGDPSGPAPATGENANSR